MIKTNQVYNYLYGPVPSRRFGRSLGVDLTPFKTCSFDCVFCQLGRTTQKTVLRKEYVPIDAVLTEIQSWLETDGDADCVTLSGSGEPTLHSDFGKVLRVLKQNPIPSALLTNGSMLVHPEVRDAAGYADIVKISLSAWDQRSFEWINRPHPQLQFNELINGLKSFRAQFSGKLWMEIFIMLGINSSPEAVKKIATQIKKIQPDSVQLNTVARPPAEEFAAPIQQAKLASLAGIFEPPAEVIAEFNANSEKHIAATEASILSMLQRRPCTTAQIVGAYGMHISEVSKYLGELMRTGQILEKRKKGDVYYAVARRGLERGLKDENKGLIGP
ncbi:MAG: radical SAM protein [Desulfobacteraceae bacterium]|nr:MAG: radical SAM protein [Desulfobacteraceae bacterium]